MISRLPPWGWTGAWVLAFIAGMVNVVGLLGFEHLAITHLTGNASLFAEVVARQDALATLDASAMRELVCKFPGA